MRILTCLLLACLGFYRADLNSDGRVDYRDLVIFSKEWMMAEYYLQFDGAGYIGLVYDETNPQQFDETIWTIEFIYRTPSDGSGGGTIFDAYDDSSVGDTGNGLLITCDSDGKPTILIDAIGHGTRTRTSTGTFTAGTWYHCLFSFEKQVQSIWYINGIAAGDGAGAPYGGSYDIGKSFYIGCNFNETLEGDARYENHFKGDIRNFGYYVGKALSAEDTAARYVARDFSGNEGSLSWASNINDGSGLDVTDVLGNINGTISSLDNVSWALLATLLQSKINEAIKTKFDDAEFTYVNNLYFEKASQDAGLDYAVFHWIDSTEKHLMNGNLEAVTIQFNLYMIAVDDIGSSVQEFIDTFDWCSLSISGYDHISMEREFTRNVGLIDDVWQIVLSYEILVSY